MSTASYLTGGSGMPIWIGLQRKYWWLVLTTVQHTNAFKWFKVALGL